MTVKMTVPISTLLRTARPGPYEVGVTERGKIAVFSAQDRSSPVCTVSGSKKLASGQDLAHAELIAHSLEHLPKLLAAARALLAGDRNSHVRLHDAVVAAEQVTCYP